MDILIIQCFNALLYASILFLIAGGLSLLYGVMRIVNLAHGTLYAMGAYVAAWLVGMAATAGLPPGSYSCYSWRVRSLLAVSAP